MSYAEVAVDAPVGRHTYSYSVPHGIDIRAGQLVWVPFGARTARGVVVSVQDYSPHDNPKPVISVSTEYALSPGQLEVGSFISTRYLSPLYAALALFLPPGIERTPAVFYEPGTDPEGADAGMDRMQFELLSAARQRGRLDARTLRSFGREARVRRALDELVGAGLLVRREIPRERRVPPRTELVATLRMAIGESSSSERAPRRRKSPVQDRIIAHLASVGGAASASELRQAVGATAVALRALETRGMVDLHERRIWRKTIAAREFGPYPVPSLTPAQSDALGPLLQDIAGGTFSENLLFGVTGSGKTELYLRATQMALDRGRQVVCLVPEISLAAQTVERFVARFAGRVSLLHSGLTPGQQRDEWDRVLRGDSDVVIGPRSALFAPVADLGLVILDEEHEWTYKQDDVVPRYHARDVARELARVNGAVMVLGSATPDVDTFHRAETGDVRLLELPTRISGRACLPSVEVVNMRNELLHGNTSLFSRALSTAIGETLTCGGQVLLFLNRRGTATLVQCRRCAYVFLCPRCSVALAYHAGRCSLLCHRCGYSLRIPERCPQCRRSRLRYVGVGTQRIVDEVHMLHPDARVIRWDSDISAKTRGESGLQDAVRSGQADIIVGTQMVAKGHDFPGVTLVGVVSADVGLDVPDYRASERVFQLLSQSAGRAGRGIDPGHVVMQTYVPDNYVVRAAAAHDYRVFYDAEIQYRRDAYYPPYCTIVRLLYAHVREDQARREAERVRRDLDNRIASPDLRITGPAPAYVYRLRGRYRWQLTVRGLRPVELVERLDLPRGWIVDVDPASVA